MNRWGALLLWVALVVVGCGLGPPNRPDLGAFVLDLLTGRWGEHPPWVVAEFQLMGVFPALVALLIRPDWRARIPAWPFLVASFGFGCFALLPWFVIRRARRPDVGGRLGHAAIAALLTVVAAVLVGWAAAAGDFVDLPAMVATEGFTWAMTFDFAAFWILSVAEARVRSRGTPWALALVPIVGLGVFLVLEARRPR